MSPYLGLLCHRSNKAKTCCLHSSQWVRGCTVCVYCALSLSLISYVVSQFCVVSCRPAVMKAVASQALAPPWEGTVDVPSGVCCPWRAATGAASAQCLLQCASHPAFLRLSAERHSLSHVLAAGDGSPLPQPGRDAVDWGQERGAVGPRGLWGRESRSSQAVHGVGVGVGGGAGFWALPSGRALPTAAPKRRQFEKATETRPRVTRLGWPWPVKGAAVCVCPPSPAFPCVPIGWCLLAVRLPGEGEGGREPPQCRGAHFASPPLRCPMMLGDHSGVPSDRALLSQPPKTGLSCKMVLQAVGRVLR